MLQLDLADLNNIPSKAEEALSMHGCVDILVNNGGISYRGIAVETTIEVDQRLMTVNYFGSVALTKGKGNVSNSLGGGGRGTTRIKDCKHAAVTTNFLNILNKDSTLKAKQNTHYIKIFQAFNSKFDPVVKNLFETLNSWNFNKNLPFFLERVDFYTLCEICA